LLLLLFFMNDCYMFLNKDRRLSHSI